MGQDRVRIPFPSRCHLFEPELAETPVGDDENPHLVKRQFADDMNDQAGAIKKVFGKPWFKDSERAAKAAVNRKKWPKSK